jgi:hypothetical protein
VILMGGFLEGLLIGTVANIIIGTVVMQGLGLIIDSGLQSKQATFEDYRGGLNG